MEIAILRATQEAAMKPKSTLFIMTSLVASILVIGSVVVAQFGGGPEPKPGIEPAAPAVEASQPAVLAEQGAPVSEEAGPSVVVEPTNPADEESQQVVAPEQSAPTAAASQPAVSIEQNASASTVPAAGQASSTQNAFSMIILSDPQYPWWRHGWDPDNDESDEVKAKANLTNQNTVNAINRIIALRQWPTAPTLIRGAGSDILQPSGVIINGDLTAFWHPWQFDAYNKYYSQVRYQIYPGLGNHDYHNNTTANDDNCQYYTLNLSDPNRCAKEAIWWMANQIQFALPNVVHKDLPGYVGVRNMGAFVTRFAVNYMLDGVIRFESTGTFGILQWRSIIIPRGATDIHVTIERHTGFSWAVVDSYAFPRATVACYKVSGTTLDANSEATTCPVEWPNGTSSSLSYSFDIGNFHFVQLQYHPGYDNELPFTAEQNIRPSIPGSPGFTVTESYDWLRNDVQVATRAGKYIVINIHAAPGDDNSDGELDDAELAEAIWGQNVVAIFSGHVHETYGYRRTHNNGLYKIPVFYSGAVECERFLLVEFHPRHFNVGVINSSGALPAFVQSDDEVCEIGGYYEDPVDPSANIDYGTNGARTAPRTFIINRPPTVVGKLQDSRPQEGAVLSFRADGNDPDADALTYQWAFGDGATATGQTPQHIYPDSGVYTVSVTATDGYGGAATRSFEVNIDNLAPTVDAGPNQTVNEGQAVSLAPATFNDKGTLDTHTAAINWGDGSPVEFGVVSETPFGPPGSSAGMDGRVNDSHVYADNGSYTVQVCVSDDDGGVGCDAFFVTVHNVAPGVNAGFDRTAKPGEAVRLAASPVRDQAIFVDLGTLDTHTATINWGDGSPMEAGAVVETPSGPPGSTVGTAGFVVGTHSYTSAGAYIITACVRDDENATGCDSLLVTVSEEVLTVNAGPDQTAAEGEVVSLAPASFHDDNAADTHSATINWGDGSPTEAGAVVEAPSGPPGSDGMVSDSHVYADDGAYTVAICVTDSTNATACDTLVITITNAMPTLNVGPNQTATEGDVISLGPATFSDKGTLDTHTATVNWGDGSGEQPGAVGESPFGPPGSTTGLTGAITAEHVYADNGVFTVQVCVSDDGTTVCDAFTATIANAMPTLNVGPNQTATEGDVISLGPATFSDKGTLDTHTATVNWGDGSGEQPGTVIESPFGPPGSTTGLTGAITAEHVYADNGVFTVQVCVSDDGTTVCDAFTATVANAAPTINVGLDQTAGEGDNVSLTQIIFSDNGTLDTHTATVNWGDGSGEQPGTVIESPFGPPGSTMGLTGAITTEHIYADDGAYIITVCVTDDDGGTGCDAFTLTVNNVAPTATFANLSGIINPGGTATLAFNNPFDPSPADTAAGFEYLYDCEGDGVFEAPATTRPEFDCAYPDAGAFDAIGRIQDKDGGFTDYLALVIVNTPPIAVDDTASTAQDTPVTVPVLDNDSDPDGDPLVVVEATAPANGNAVVNPDNTITYTPDPGYHGPDKFTYTIADSSGLTASATVSITVVKFELITPATYSSCSTEPTSDTIVIAGVGNRQLRGQVIVEYVTGPSSRQLVPGGFYPVRHRGPGDFVLTLNYPPVAEWPFFIDPRTGRPVGEIHVDIQIAVLDADGNLIRLPNGEVWTLGPGQDWDVYCLNSPAP
jgi:PKD repeat protein/cytolysin (calcineurin-like family phosphatase)